MFPRLANLSWYVYNVDHKVTCLSTYIASVPSINPLMMTYVGTNAAKPDGNRKMVDDWAYLQHGFQSHSRRINERIHLFLGQVRAWNINWFRSQPTDQIYHFPATSTASINCRVVMMAPKKRHPVGFMRCCYRLLFFVSMKSSSTTCCSGPHVSGMKQLWFRH